MTTIILPPETVKEPLNLRAYGGEIENVKLLTPLSRDTPVEELQRRYREDGVIWIKNIINRDLVNKCRREYLNFVNQGSGMLKPDTDPEEGIFSGADWRDFVLPGGVRLAMGLEDKDPFVDNAINSHVAPFYLAFKDEVARQVEPFVGEICGFEDPWCLPPS